MENNHLGSIGECSLIEPFSSPTVSLPQKMSQTGTVPGWPTGSNRDSPDLTQFIEGEGSSSVFFFHAIGKFDFEIKFNSVIWNVESFHHRLDHFFIRRVFIKFE